MTRLFDSSLIESHDLYHAKYGRGAVIIPIRKDPDNVTRNGTINSDKYVARLYNSRELGSVHTAPPFDPVLSIEEESGLVKVTLRFEYRNPSRPSYRPVKATIERVIPNNQITLEIVRDNEST